MSSYDVHVGCPEYNYDVASGRLTSADPIK